MAKRKKLTKRVHHHVRRLRKDPRVKKHAPIGVLVIGVAVGFLLAQFQAPPVHPKSLVWAAEDNLSVPDDLVGFLHDQRNCKHDDGKPRDTGVSLWSVYKLSQGKFAKVAYGCSYDLSFYQMAILENGKWGLLDQSEYLANSFLPKCAQVEKYKIDKSIEPFCLDETGGSRENAILAE